MPARLVLNRDAATAKATADHLLAEQLGTEGAHVQNVGHDFGKPSPVSVSQRRGAVHGGERMREYEFSVPGYQIILLWPCSTSGAGPAVNSGRLYRYTPALY
jgi:hypothetical protein